jgi:hypothetical protein
MPYRIAGIDVHKKKLAVVVADVEVEDEYQFERRWYGSNPEQLQLLVEWLMEQQVEEVVIAYASHTAPHLVGARHSRTVAVWIISRLWLSSEDRAQGPHKDTRPSRCINVPAEDRQHARMQPAWG